MVLPHLLSYPDPKFDAAYHRYQDGETQRALSKALGIPARSLARLAKADGWEDERRARKEEAQTPILAAEATEPAAKLAADSPLQAGDQTQPIETTAQNALPNAPVVPSIPEPEEEVLEGRPAQERELRRQVRIYGWLAKAAERAAGQLMADYEKKPARAVMSQVAQLTTILGRLFEVGRKALRVPDKMEVEDMTPTAADRVRSLPDEQLSTRIEVARTAAMEAARRGGATSLGGATPEEGIN
jgi:hypothetical protein